MRAELNDGDRGIRRDDDGARYRQYGRLSQEDC